MDIFEGSVNKERFLAFLQEQVVSGFILCYNIIQQHYQAPQLNPYPGKQSVVILDNCSIHHDEDIHELIVEECGELSWLCFPFSRALTRYFSGACLVYLPPYSPDFNSIEEAFSAIQAWQC
jgi:transposase